MLNYIKDFFAKIIISIVCFYIVIMADPDDILRQDNKDPYRNWVIKIAKIKKRLWRSKK